MGSLGEPKGCANRDETHFPMLIMISSGWTRFYKQYHDRHSHLVSTLWSHLDFALLGVVPSPSEKPGRFNLEIANLLPEWRV